MASKKEHEMMYERRSGKTMIKIMGSSKIVAPLAWLDRAATLLSTLTIGIGCIASQWTILLVLRWIKHKIMQL